VKCASILTAFVFVAFPTRASSLPLELKTEEEVARVILAARETIFVSAPQLRGRTVADALRRAAVERGVRVFILCEARRTLDPGGFVAALSLLRQRDQPLEVRVVQSVFGFSLVVDEAQTVNGPLVGEPRTFGQTPTRLDLELRVALERAKRFREAWIRAKPWIYRVQNPRFQPRGR
jgi:hypothetical protein